MPDAEQLVLLKRRGVTLEHSDVTAVEGEGADISHMQLADGRHSRG